MAPVFATVIGVSLPSSSHELNFMSHVTFHDLRLVETSSPPDVAANRSQLRGFCPISTFQQQILLHDVHFFLLYSGCVFQGDLFLIFRVFLSTRFIFHFAFTMDGPFHLNGPSKCCLTVQLDLDFTGSCYFWCVFHLSLTLQTGSRHSTHRICP